MNNNNSTMPSVKVDIQSIGSVNKFFDKSGYIVDPSTTVFDLFCTIDKTVDNKGFSNLIFSEDKQEFSDEIIVLLNGYNITAFEGGKTKLKDGDFIFVLEMDTLGG